MASSLLDVCRFNPTLGGTTDWTYSSAVVGYQSPTAAGAVNGAVYSYRAESADLLQWEVGFGAYTSGTGVFARTTVLFNSAGTTAKISFTTAPQVAIVALAEDLLAFNAAMSLSSAQQAQAVANLGLGTPLAAWSTFTPTVTAASGTFTTVSAAGSYLQIGKMVAFVCSITITTVGTASGNVIITLPNGTSFKRAYSGAGCETAVNGIGINYFGSAAGTTINIRKFDTSTAIVAGAVLTVSGVYEAT